MHNKKKNLKKCTFYYLSKMFILTIAIAYEIMNSGVLFLCIFFSFSTPGLISMSKPSSFHSSSSDSALPGICKDLIAATVSRLRASSSEEASESLADKLTLDLLSIYNAANSIAGLYELLDDNSQENCELFLI